MRQYSPTQDCRKIYSLLVEKYSKSPEAQANAQDIRYKITNLRLDKNWKGTSTAFLNLWKNLYLQLEDLVPLEEQDTPSVKKKY